MTTGVWLTGARGSVAVTTIAGALALRAGLAEPVGCVTELPDLRSPAVPGLPDLVFGGHDIAATPLDKRAEALVAAGVLPARVTTALVPELAAVEAELRPVPTAGCQRDVARLVATDIADFRRRHALERVVVVNVASTEPAVTPHPAHDDLAALAAA